VTLLADAPPEEIEARLARLVSRERFSFRAPKEPFRGSIRGRTFKVERVLPRFLGLPQHNSFQPVIVGSVAPAAGGTEVRLVLRLPYFVVAFMAVWLGGVLLGGLAVLTSSVPDCPPAGAVAAFGGMFLFGYGLMSFSFWSEVRKARQALCEGLGCREVEPGHPMVRG
jgi:hypothetical protein